MAGGHTGPVSCIRFTFDDTFLVSSGVTDRCVMQVGGVLRVGGEEGESECCGGQEVLIYGLCRIDVGSI